MKKIFLILVTIFIFSECYAFEYEYSEWSPIYPGKVKDKIFIEEEDRFLWYRDVQKNIEYKVIDEINDSMEYDISDIKYETNYMLNEPKKYKERISKLEFNDYYFKDTDIDGLLLDKVGDINISEIEIYNKTSKIDYKTSYKNLYDGEYNYNNYKNKSIKIALKEFDESFRIVIYYNSSDDEQIEISYRSIDKYNVYSKKITFNKCDSCKLEININDLRSYRNQYIPIYKYTDKLYKTYDLEREYTKDYYTEYEGYIKDESTLRKYYRFIMNDYVIVNRSGKIITDSNDCIKELCLIKYQYKEIENLKTGDNIYLYSSSLILIVFLIIKKYLVLSKRNKSFNNYSNI